MPVRTRLERAADARRGLALLLGDRDDVALRLALDAQARPRVRHRHHLLAVDAQQHDVGVDRGLGQRAVDDGARLLGDDRDLRNDVHRDPAALEERGDVGVAGDFVERLEAVGDAARRCSCRGPRRRWRTCGRRPSSRTRSPPGTRPVRPSSVGAAIGSSNAGTSAGASAAKVIAIGGAPRRSDSVSVEARAAQSCGHDAEIPTDLRILGPRHWADQTRGGPPRRRGRGGRSSRCRRRRPSTRRAAPST